MSWLGKWSRLIGARGLKLGGVQGPMLGRRDGARSGMKWEVEEMRETGLAMNGAEGGGYEGKWSDEMVLRFQTWGCLAWGSNLMKEGLW